VIILSYLVVNDNNTNMGGILVILSGKKDVVSNKIRKNFTGFINKPKCLLKKIIQSVLNSKINQVK
jgi:hypothetical protein